MSTNLATASIGKFQQTKYLPTRPNLHVKNDGVFLVNIKVQDGRAVHIKPHIINSQHTKQFANMLAQLNRPSKPAVAIQPAPSFHYVHYGLHHNTHQPKKSFRWQALVLGVVAIAILLLLVGPLFGYISSALSKL